MGFKAFGGVEHVKFCLCGTVGCKGGLVGGFGGVGGVRCVAGLLAAAAGAAALGAVGRFGAAAARGAGALAAGGLAACALASARSFGGRGAGRFGGLRLRGGGCVVGVVAAGLLGSGFAAAAAGVGERAGLGGAVAAPAPVTGGPVVPLGIQRFILSIAPAGGAVRLALVQTGGGFIGFPVAPGFFFNFNGAEVGATSYKKFLLKFKGEIDEENVNFAKRDNAETAMIFLKKYICN